MKTYLRGDIMDRQTVIDNGTLLHTCEHSGVRYYRYDNQVWGVFKKHGFSDVAYLFGSLNTEFYRKKCGIK
jgi:hypothetical protein